MQAKTQPRFTVLDVRGEATRIIDSLTGEVVAYVDPAGAQRMADQRNRQAKARTMILAVTLASGERFAFPVAKMPRHWKSWVMQECPYGTDFYGCTFSREIAS